MSHNLTKAKKDVRNWKDWKVQVSGGNRLAIESENEAEKAVKMNKNQLGAEREISRRLKNAGRQARASRRTSVITPRSDGVKCSICISECETVYTGKMWDNNSWMATLRGAVHWDSRHTNAFARERGSSGQRGSQAKCVTRTTLPHDVTRVK